MGTHCHGMGEEEDIGMVWPKFLALKTPKGPWDNFPVLPTLNARKPSCPARPVNKPNCGSSKACFKFGGISKASR